MRTVHDPVAALSVEWRQVGWFRRVLIRMLAPRVAREAAAIGRGEYPQYVQVPVYQQKAGPGPVTRGVEKIMAGGR